MKHFNNRSAAVPSRRGFKHSGARRLGTAALRSRWLCFVALLGSLAVHAALPAEWQHAQQFDVAAPGLVKISLPVETLDAARPALEDLRLCDDAGNELPFLIARPMPSPKAVQSAKSFQVSLNAAATVITLETGLAQPLDGVTLETPAANFIKAVRVEGSADGQNWQRLAQGQPIFRQLSGASQLRCFISRRRVALAAAHRGRPAFAAGSVHRRPRPRRRCPRRRRLNCKPPPSPSGTKIPARRGSR